MIMVLMMVMMMKTKIVVSMKAGSEWCASLCLIWNEPEMGPLSNQGYHHHHYHGVSFVPIENHPPPHHDHDNKFTICLMWPVCNLEWTAFGFAKATAPDDIEPLNIPSSSKSSSSSPPPIINHYHHHQET